MASLHSGRSGWQTAATGEGRNNLPWRELFRAAHFDGFGQLEDSGEALQYVEETTVTRVEIWRKKRYALATI